MNRYSCWLLGCAATFVVAASGCTAPVGAPPSEATGQAKQADVGSNVNAYAFVDSDGTVESNYSSSGIAVYNVAPGRYAVYLYGYQASTDWTQPQGIAQVSARGQDNTRCGVSYAYLGVVPAAVVEVLCWGPDETPRNSDFLMTFVRRTDTTGIEGGYVLFDPLNGAYPKTISSTATDQYAHWNSTGGDIILDHQSPGLYLVTFKGQSYYGGTAQVTAAGFNEVSCEINGWWRDDNGDQNVAVACLDPQDNFADTTFSLTATSGSPANSSYYTYAWADNPVPAASYVPDLGYQIGFRRGECTAQTDSPVTIAPTGPDAGDYVVTFPNMGSFAAFHSNVIVSAYGADGEYCKIFSWGGTASGSAYAVVHCFDYTGQPAPSFFTITYSVDQQYICIDPQGP